MVQWLQTIFKTLGLQVSNAPTPIYEDIQPIIYILESNHIIGIVKHIPVPIHSVHEKYVLPTIDYVELKTTICPAYICTKSSAGSLLECH